MSPHWEIRTASDGFGPIVPQALATVTRVDPYSVWANATHYRDLGGMPRGRIPIAIEMKPGGETARQFAQTIERNGWHDWIRMPALYRNPPPALDAARFCTAQITCEFYARLGTDLAGRFERFTETLAVAPHADAPVNPLPPAPAPMRAEPGNAIVGVIDEDLAFAHPRFSEVESAARTRFECFWNQNDATDSAAGLGYGSELFKHQMDALVHDARRSAEASQAAGGGRVYPFDYPSPTPQHGDDLDAPLPMIGVQLKKRSRTMRDVFGPSPDATMLDAVRYIVQRAQDIGGAACHALVSMSAGNAAWQPDGSSLIEGALDELMDTGACSVVLPSGNADLSRCRSVLTLAEHALAELRWPVRAHASSPSVAEIWLASDDGAPGIDVQIVPPGGIASPWLTLGEIGTYTRGIDAICTVVHLGRGARGNGHMILIALAPTSTRSGTRRATAGEWLVRLRNNGRASATASAWMQYDADADS